MSNQYRRGEVYLVSEAQTEGREIKKTRPWVLVGANPINKARGTIVAVPLSTQANEIPSLSIKINFNNVTCYAVLDQIRAIDKKRIIRFEGSLMDYEIDLINDGLRNILCL